MQRAVDPGGASAPPESDSSLLERLFSDDSPTEPTERSGWGSWWLIAAVLTALTVVGGIVSEAFRGFPKGFDAYGHASKTQLLVDNWPAVHWNYAWYAGMPNFEGSYPPGYHATVGALAGLSGMSVFDSMVVVTSVAMVATVLGVAAFVRVVTGRRLGALVAGTFIVAAPTFWAQSTVLGLYPRLLAFMFLALALPCAALAAQRWTRPRVAATVVLLGLTLSSHLIIGAAGALLVALILLVAPGISRRERVLHPIGTVAATGALVGYFYLPFLLKDTAEKSRFTSDNRPISPSWLFWPEHPELASLPLALLPLTVVGIVVLLRVASRSDSWRTAVEVVEPGTARRRIAAVEGHRPTRVEQLRGWSVTDPQLLFQVFVVLWCTLGAAAVFGYALVGHVLDFRYYVRGLQPNDLLVYAAWLLAATLGIALDVLQIRAAGRRTAWLRAGSLVLACVALAVTLPLLPDRVRDAHGGAQQAIVDMLPPESEGQRQYRVMGPTDGTSRAINAVSDAPQIRGYQDHGILDIDWQVWHEISVKETEVPVEVRDYLFDWYAVRWFYGDFGFEGRTGEDFARLAAHPDRYRLIESANLYTPVAFYEYTDPRPVHSAVSAPTVLVVGKDPNHDYTLRSLSYTGVKSDDLTLLHGPESIDDLDEELLEQADAVVLYGATADDLGRAARLLGDYVRDGGGLFLDAADDHEFLARLAREEGSPVPVVESREVVVRDDWEVRRVGDTCFNAAATAALPSDEGESGLYTTIAAERIATWAHSSVSLADGVVMVEGQLGAGRVVWSGLNLPFLTDVTRSAPISHGFLDCLDMVRAEPPTTAAAAPRYSFTFVSPQHREISVESPARAVLVREYATPNWHAYVDGEAAPLLRAGPDMMYVPLPQDGQPHQVSLRYRLSGVERAGIALTLLTLTGLVMWCAGWLPLGALSGRFRDLLRSRRRATVAE